MVLSMRSSSGSTLRRSPPVFAFFSNRLGCLGSLLVSIVGTIILIVLVNLLHLISGNEVAILLQELSTALAPGGISAIYGPFLRDGEATSEGDATFHASLRAQDPAIGYKDIIDVTGALAGHGLRIFETVKMPANNLMICAERPA
jgi:hypothetical protein